MTNCGGWGPSRQGASTALSGHAQGRVSSLDVRLRPRPRNPVAAPAVGGPAGVKGPWGQGCSTGAQAPQSRGFSGSVSDGLRKAGPGSGLSPPPSTHSKVHPLLPWGHHSIVPAPVTPTLVRPRTEFPLPDPPGPECHCPRRAEFRAGDVPLGLSQGTVQMEEPTEPQNRNSLYFSLPYADKAHFSRSVVSDSVTPWTAAHQASLSITSSWSLLKLMSMESVMPSSHLILCLPLLLPRSIFPSIRVFSNESVLCIRWPKD